MKIEEISKLKAGETMGGAFYDWLSVGKQWAFPTPEKLAAYAAKEARVCGAWFNGVDYYPIFDTADTVIYGEEAPYAEP